MIYGTIIFKSKSYQVGFKQVGTLISRGMFGTGGLEE